MRQVTAELQGRGNLGTAHVYKSTLNAILTFQGSEKLMFRQLTSEWVKRFEISLRERGCSWNTVSTYLRTLRAVYNRAVDRRKAVYVPHLFRSVYTGTRADRQRALDGEDMRKVFTRLPQSRMFHCLVIKVLCLSVSQTAHLLYHISFHLSRTFFKFFRCFSRCCQVIGSLADSLFTLPHSERIVNKFFDFFQSFSNCFFKRIISL